MMKRNNQFLTFLLLTVGLVMGCSDDEHGHSHEGEEMINEVELTFTPVSGGSAVTATWFDADGDGQGNPTIDDITLTSGVSYTLSISLGNTLEGEDKTSEILAEAGEHMFFFAFTSDIFSDPTGNGNTDNRSDEINYNDFDSNQEPLGLNTSWTAGDATTSTGTFRVVLKHQPGLKTSTSDITVGGTDLDIDFPILINAAAPEVQ